MARKPSSQQTLLPFPDPDELPPPEANDPPHLEGDHDDAVQDHRARTVTGAAEVARAAPLRAEAAAGAGTLFQGLEDLPRSLEGAAGPGEAGQRPAADRQRSGGDR